MSERTALEIADQVDAYVIRTSIGAEAAAMLRKQHAEIERLSAINTALASKSQTFVAENAWLTEKIDRLTAEKFRRFNNAECWIYQRNGENPLDRLKCPVVISPEELLSMRAEVKCLTAERDAAAASAVLTERIAIAAQLREWAEELGFTNSWRWKTPRDLLYRAAEKISDRTKP